jgi:phosphotransferase system enzyme I (PtsI)
MNCKMRGIGVSSGIANGYVLKKAELLKVIEKKIVTDSETEIERLNNARKISLGRIEKLLCQLTRANRSEEAQIFEAHQALINDEIFFGEVEKKVIAENVNVEWALEVITKKYLKSFEDLEDEYLKERKIDIIDVMAQITNILMGIEESDFKELSDNVVIVAKDLAPSDFAKINLSKVIGFVTERGSQTSHVSIMARSYGLPAVAGLEGIWKQAENGDVILVDGETGTVILNPTNAEIDVFQMKQQKLREFNVTLKALKDCQTLSQDGLKLEIAANIGAPREVEAVLENGGEGIGLYRTEFLYMSRNSFPSEEEQFIAYKTVVEKMNGKPVVIRTLDVGGDKNLPYMDISKEDNPFLGYRAIRICLENDDIFKTQLRALLRASKYGNLKIMFPMISCIEELQAAKAKLKVVVDELKRENIAINEKIEVGMMVEIPAAAINADMFAKEVDFFSIGTNDLIQYSLAVDRGNQKIAHLYNQLHPAVLRLIQRIIAAAHQENIWVGICGEAAADPRLAPVFAAMGIDELSVNSKSILKIRWMINNSSCREMKKVVTQIMNMPTAGEIENYLQNKIKLM